VGSFGQLGPPPHPPPPLTLVSVFGMECGFADGQYGYLPSSGHLIWRAGALSIRTFPVDQAFSDGRLFFHTEYLPGRSTGRCGGAGRALSGTGYLRVGVPGMKTVWPWLMAVRGARSCAVHAFLDGRHATKSARPFIELRVPISAWVRAQGEA